MCVFLCACGRAHLDSLLDYCKTGVSEGATLVYGGKRVDRPGQWKLLVMIFYSWQQQHVAFGCLIWSFSMLRKRSQHAIFAYLKIVILLVCKQCCYELQSQDPESQYPGILAAFSIPALSIPNPGIGINQSVIAIHICCFACLLLCFTMFLCIVLRIYTIIITNNNSNKFDFCSEVEYADWLRYLLLTYILSILHSS